MANIRLLIVFLATIFSSSQIFLAYASKLEAACIHRISSNAPDCQVAFRTVFNEAEVVPLCVEANTFVLPVHKFMRSSLLSTARITTVFAQVYAKINCTSPIQEVDFDFGGPGNLELVRFSRRESGSETSKLYHTNVDMLITPDATGKYNFFHSNNRHVTTGNFTFFLFVEKTSKPYLVGVTTKTNGQLEPIRIIGENTNGDGGIILPCITTNRNVAINVFKKASSSSSLVVTSTSNSSSTSSSTEWIQVPPEQIKRDNKVGLTIQSKEPATYRCTTGRDVYDMDSLSVVVVEGDGVAKDMIKPVLNEQYFTLTSTGNITITCSYDNPGAAANVGTKPLELQVFYVKNPSEAKLLETCLLEKHMYCGSPTYNGPLSSAHQIATDCPLSSTLCSSIHDAYREGLAFCFNPNTNEYIAKEYFSGMDGRSYFGLKDAPASAFIIPRWSPGYTNATFLEGTEVVFTCEVLPNLFNSNSFSIGIKYRNGTMTQPELTTMSSYSSRPANWTTIPYGTSWKGLRSSFWSDTNITEISCITNVPGLLRTVNSTVAITVQEKPCLSTQFKCRYGGCTSYSYRCDGGRDCRDGSDEEDCASHVCRPGYFRCNSGKCIPLSSLCDGSVDCPGGLMDDETKEACQTANRTCNYFKCTAGQCVSLYQVCNNAKNCLDGSDETEAACANKTCAADEFRCRTGQCVTRTSLCRGYTSCLDGSKETAENCTEATRQKCTSEHFQCKNGACITARYRCDGDRDCGDGSDEVDCPGKAVPKIVNDTHAVTFLPNTMNELIFIVKEDLSAYSTQKVTYINFYFNGRNITNDARIWADYKTGLQWSIRFPSVSAMDEGIYLFQAYNRFGHGAHKINVTVTPDTSCPRDLNYHSCLLRKCYMWENECITEAEYNRLTKSSKHGGASSSLVAAGGDQNMGEGVGEGTSTSAGHIVGYVLLALAIIAIVFGLGIFGWRYHNRVQYQYPPLTKKSGRTVELEADDQSSF